MMHEKERQKVMESLEAQETDLMEEVAQIKGQKAAFKKVAVFEETYQGLIKDLEESACKKVADIMESLVKETENSYATISIIPIPPHSAVAHTAGPDLEAMIQHTIGVNKHLLDPTEGVSFHAEGKRQRDAVRQLVHYCRKHPLENDEAMKNWIIKAVIEA